MKRSVFVIDDDEIYQKIIGKLIKRANVFFEAHFYTGAREALNNLVPEKNTYPDVILLDINMPVMDGWQFLEEFQKLNPDHYKSCEIYIVTSSIATSDKEKAREIDGISGFLSKPVSVEKLKEIAEASK